MALHGLTNSGIFMVQSRTFFALMSRLAHAADAPASDIDSQLLR
jgi:hypothetical protein